MKHTEPAPSLFCVYLFVVQRWSPRRASAHLEVLGGRSRARRLAVAALGGPCGRSGRCAGMSHLWQWVALVTHSGGLWPTLDAPPVPSGLPGPPLVRGGVDSRSGSLEAPRIGSHLHIVHKLVHTPIGQAPCAAGRSRGRRPSGGRVRGPLPRLTPSVLLHARTGPQCARSHLLTKIGLISTPLVCFLKVCFLCLLATTTPTHTLYCISNLTPLGSDPTQIQSLALV